MAEFCDLGALTGYTLPYLKEHSEQLDGKEYFYLQFPYLELQGTWMTLVYEVHTWTWNLGQVNDIPRKWERNSYIPTLLNMDTYLSHTLWEA